MTTTALHQGRFLLAAVVVFVATSSFAQSTAVWRDVNEKAMLGAATRTKADARRNISPQIYRTVGLNRPGLEAMLAAAPREFSGPMGVVSVELELPLPDGSMGRFSVQESPVMEPKLAAKYPEIRTYVAQGIDDPAANARIDLTPQGFHAMILSPRGQVFIDPYWRDSDATYVVYKKSDSVADNHFSCLVQTNEKEKEHAQTGGARAISKPTGATLRTYRLALACTGEYAAAACSPNAPTGRDHGFIATLRTPS